MNRSEALRLWRRIADGDLEREQYDPVDLHAWIRGVAEKVIKADEVPDGVRPGTLVDAIGLAGQRDKYFELRERLQLLDSFDFIVNGEAAPEPRGHRRKARIAEARRSGLFDDEPDLTDIELNKRIDRLMKRG